jgi:DNA-binding NarL/FixJ family response regulator
MVWCQPVRQLSEGDAVTVVVGTLGGLMGRGVAAALGEDPGLSVLASDLAAADLEREIAQQLPRVAILDEGVDHALLARLRSCHPATGVLVLAQSPTQLLGTSLLAVGATCLAWGASVAEIVTAVHRAAQGEPTFFGVHGNRVARHGPAINDVLTPSETRVFEHLTLGRSYAEIGRALHIAPETARTHTGSICKKLNVNGKRELIGMPLPFRFAA